MSHFSRLIPNDKKLKVVSGVRSVLNTNQAANSI